MRPQCYLNTQWQCEILSKVEKRAGVKIVPQFAHDQGSEYPACHSFGMLHFITGILLMRGLQTQTITQPLPPEPGSEQMNLLLFE